MQADTDQSVAKDQQAAIARGDSAREVPVTRGLSAQLLVLTIAFVMVAEVLIYVPSVARYRHVFLQERIETVGDDADLQEVYDTERHLLYVACTRARDHLLVTGVDPASEFLDDFMKGDQDSAVHTLK